jgi:hypothetical protein
METLIAKWVRETISEYNLAKSNQNLFKMSEMDILKKALLSMRDKLLKNQGIVVSRRFRPTNFPAIMSYRIFHLVS